MMTPPLRLGARAALALIAGSLLLGAPAARAAEDVIEKIEVRGLRRMTMDAFIFASGLKEGQPYDVPELRRAFRRLYARGLFSDLKLEAEDGETGKILIFTAEERPIITTLDYDEARAITRSNIEDRFKERNLVLTVGKPLDRRLISRAEDLIRDLLGEKGHLDATVKAEITKISEFSSGVRFRIRQGPKTRIREIDFVGNDVFSDRRLKKAMKLTREHSLFSAIGGKDIYFPLKYDQDIEKVRELYQNAGYLDVDLKPPQIEIRESKKTRKRREKREREEAERKEAPSGTVEPPADESERQRRRRERREEKEREKAKKKAEEEERKERKWVYLTVRVSEGPQYRVGEIRTTGNTIFEDKELIRSIPLVKGRVLNRGLLDLGVDLIRAAYEEKGHIYASIGRSVTKREGDVADVTVEIREDRPYYIDRIEFEGNTTTRDEVLRREMRVNEGDLLNKKRLSLSVFKLNQLGFIVPTEEPIIEPIAGTDRARVRIRTEERGKNEIQVGGGFSGQEGFFFAGSYSTRNFLGRGQDLGVALQVGGRSSRYSLTFTEHYFLGKPVQLGFSVFRRDIEFARRSTRSGSGGSIALGRQIGNFSRASILYAFETIRFTDRTFGISGGSFTSETNTQIGSLTPAFTYDRVNNPFRPTSGRRFSVSAAVAGEYIGGDNNFVKPIVRATQYLPLTRSTFLGFNAEIGVVRPYGVGATFGGRVLGLPQFERFFLGGDLLGPRIYETRSISPVRFISRDGESIERRRSQIVKFKGRDRFGQRIEKCLRPEFDHTLDTVVDPATGARSNEYARCDNGLRRVLVGGDRYFLLQMEYSISAGESPFVFAFFLDAGNALAEDEGFNFDETRLSFGIETRIYLPVFQAPLRFIYGIPIHEQPFDSTNQFQFSIGQSF